VQIGCSYRQNDAFRSLKSRHFALGLVPKPKEKAGPEAGFSRNAAFGEGGFASWRRRREAAY
jgi:hypothetical protein